MTTPPEPPLTPPPPPVPGTPPPGFASNEEKTWALIAHFGGAVGMFFLFGVGGWIAPLIAMVAKGDQSPTIREHAVKALNFQLTWSIVGVIGYVTICIVIGFIIFPVAALMGIIFGIIAGVKANDGQLYEYPAAIKMIK
jgi:hypothetical protein